MSAPAVTTAPFRHGFVIPAYGDSPYLDGCLASIAAQTQASGDVLITTSTPSAYIEAAARRHQVRLVVNPRRSSIGSDWNFALATSAADYVTIAHQDDTYRADYLERMAMLLKDIPDALIGFTDYVETTDDGVRPLNLNLRVKRFLTRHAFGSRDAIRDDASRRRLVAWGNPVCCPSVVLNRRRLHDFRFTESLHSNLDWDAWHQLSAREGAFLYVRQPLVIRRIHGQSETSALIANKRRVDEDRAMFRHFWPAPVAALITLVYRAGYLANRP